MSRGVPIQTEHSIKSAAHHIVRSVQQTHVSHDSRIKAVAHELTSVWMAGRAHEESLALRVGLIAGGIIGAVLYAVFRELMS